jgi:hypothetical protein
MELSLSLSLNANANTTNFLIQFTSIVLFITVSNLLFHPPAQQLFKCLNQLWLVDFTYKDFKFSFDKATI